MFIKPKPFFNRDLIGEDEMKIFTKESLIQELKEIRNRGWIPNNRGRNDGAVGNILEDLLGIEENNLPIPNAAEWELKCQRMEMSSLTTLFHFEPSPRAFRFVPKVLLPMYGWGHQQAGGRYGIEERSFRQTISGNSRSDRGFKVVLDKDSRKVLVSFDYKAVDARHNEWLKEIERNVGLGELNPQPYWGFDDLEHKAGTKLLNCFFCKASCKRENGMAFFRYDEIYILSKFSIEAFAKAIEDGLVYIDFDARTGHNHGTKFRLKQGYLQNLYEHVKVL
jgi:hypothetical protein